MKVFIDGENFRRSTTSQLGEGKEAIFDLNIVGLLRDILGLGPEMGLSAAYYSSRIKLPLGYQPSKVTLEKVLAIRQFNRAWVPRLKQQGIEYIKAGSLKVKSSDKCDSCGSVADRLKEKGVDVRLAVDIVDNSRDEDIAVFSSDSDLIPAIVNRRGKGGEVTYICYSDFVNRAVAASASETVTITQKKLLQHWSRRNEVE